MAIESLSVLTESEGKAELKEVYGKLEDNIFTGTISSEFRNDDIVDIGGGTVVIRKLAFANVNKLGTARKSGNGQAIKAKTIKFDLDDDIEIVHSISDKDVKLFGVDNIINREANNDVVSVVKYREKKFWSEACTNGTAFTPSSSAVTVGDKLDEACVKLQSHEDDFVKGVPVDAMGIVLSPAGHSKLKNVIDKISNGTGENTYEYFHNVRVYCSTDLPEGKHCLVLAKKTIGQPYIDLECPAGIVPLSSDHYFGMAGTMGTHATSPELILVVDGIVNAE